MRSSKKGTFIKAIRKVNSFSGFLALLLLAVMLISIYQGHRSTLYYISGGLFMLFGLIFATTALMFMVRSVVWQIKSKRMRYLIRHYLYGLLVACVALLILSHITLGKVDCVNNLFYSPLLAFGSIYLSGYMLAPVRSDPT